MPARRDVLDTSLGHLLSQPKYALMLQITLALLKNYRASHGLVGINHCLTVCAPVFMKSFGISACNQWLAEWSYLQVMNHGIVLWLSYRMFQLAINMLTVQCIYFRESRNHNLKLFNKPQRDPIYIMPKGLRKGLQGGRGRHQRYMPSTIL